MFICFYHVYIPLTGLIGFLVYSSVCFNVVFIMCMEIKFDLICCMLLSCLFLKITTEHGGELANFESTGSFQILPFDSDGNNDILIRPNAQGLVSVSINP